MQAIKIARAHRETSSFWRSSRRISRHDMPAHTVAWQCSFCSIWSSTCTRSSSVGSMEEQGPMFPGDRRSLYVLISADDKAETRN